MVVGLNGIFGQHFPIFHDDPSTAPRRAGALNDFGSMPYAATFDNDDNLYVADLNRDRVFVYLRPFGDGTTEEVGMRNAKRPIWVPRARAPSMGYGTGRRGSGLAYNGLPIAVLRSRSVP
jgi:hypothetical protein